MNTAEYVPEWRLCHAPYARCTLCCGEVRDDYVWRFWETPASYVANVCQVCASTLDDEGMAQAERRLVEARR